MIYYRYLFDNIGIFFNGHKSAQVGSESVINLRSGSIIQAYGSTDPDSEDIFTDPEH